MSISPKIKINFNGKEYQVAEVDFEIKREEWSEYALMDGGTVRLKTTVQRIYRVVDDEGHPVFNADGTASVLTMHRTDVITRV